MLDEIRDLRAAESLEDFLSEPVGRYLRRPIFTYWYPCLGFTGFAVFGRPDAEATRELNRVMDVVLPPRADRHISLIDTSGLEEVERGAFLAMGTYLSQRWEAFGKVITRQAMIRPCNIVGATVAGFYEIFNPSYPVKLCRAWVDAVAWLDLPSPQATSDALRALVYAGRQSDSIVGELRTYLDAHLAIATLESAARALAISRRSLQRRLHECGTTFQAELNAHQVRVAQRLLLEGRSSVTEIAYETACASPQHFSAMFRKLVGQSPTEWRANNA